MYGFDVTGVARVAEEGAEMKEERFDTVPKLPAGVRSRALLPLLEQVLWTTMLIYDADNCAPNPRDFALAVVYVDGHPPFGILRSGVSRSPVGTSCTPTGPVTSRWERRQISARSSRDHRLDYTAALHVCHLSRVKEISYENE